MPREGERASIAAEVSPLPRWTAEPFAAVPTGLTGPPQTAGRKDTIFTLLEGLLPANSLQSLLDTTPPKRVPVLWDGSAPAPSSNTAAQLWAYTVYSIFYL